MTTMPKAAKKKSIDVDVLWQMERIANVALAPDGSQAVCSVTTFSMDDNKSAASLWLLSTSGGVPRRLTAGGENDGQARWSPDGTQIAFVAKREQQGRKDDTTQLYLIAPDGGEARRVSSFEPGIDAFKWFPDGRRVAFISWVWPGLKGSKAQVKAWKAWGQRKETGIATSEAQYRYWDQNLPVGRVAHLHVLDVATGRITDLFEGTAYELPRAAPGADGFDISPDGRHIAFAHDPAARKLLGNCNALAEINVKSGKISPLAIDPEWDFEAPRYSPDGGRIAFAASHIGLKYTMPARLAWLRRGGAWNVLSAEWDHAVNAPLRWSADGQSLWFSAEDRGRCHLYRYAIESRSAALFAQGGWVQGFDVAGSTVVVAADSMSHPVRVHAHHGDAAPRRIEHFNDALLARLRLGEVSEATVSGAGGEPVQMWLIHPPGFDARRTYPVLHNIHGGPHAAAGDTFNYRWNNHVFAAAGYVVACVNYHGSSGFGYTFLDSIAQHAGVLELQDIEAATTWLLKQPWADRKRVFASGGSYGGYLVAWMNGHVKPGRYAAFVCHAGCFDWKSMFANDDYGYQVKQMGAWYWDDPAKLQAQSADASTATMRTPTLVVHGALDYRVPDAQGLAHYNSLKMRGVDARLLWFPDETHWVQKPRNSKLWYGEFFAWLKAHDPKAAAARPKHAA